MNKLKFIYTLSALLFLFSCGKSEGLKVKGKYAEYAGKTILLQKLVGNNVEPLDSAEVTADGSFSMAIVQLLEPEFLRLFIPEINEQVLFVGKAGQDLSFSSSDGKLASTDLIEGSKESTALLAFSKETAPVEMELRGFQAKFQGAQNQLEQEQIALQYKQTAKQLSDIALAYIATNSGSPTVLFALSKMNPAENLAIYKQEVEKLKLVIPNSAYVTNLAQQLAQADKQAQQQEAQKLAEASREKLLAIGNVAPDIVLPNPMGETKKLSDLKGKVVLVDFWASWCKPCRKENPNVVRLYNAYKNDGFEVFSVSLDRSEDAWKNAIMADNLTWTHVSDLKFWQSAAAQLYGINSIPFTVLLDKDGKIVAKNLRGANLENKLKEFFGH